MNRSPESGGHASQLAPSGRGPDEIALALAAHDRAVAARGVAVWVGAEPTYTDRGSESAAWLYEALGDEKRARAGALTAILARARPGGALLRSVGRPYADEPAPRWSYGVFARRDGAVVWTGPPDPLLGEPPLPGGDAAAGSLAPDAFAGALRAGLERAGFRARRIRVSGPFPERIVYRVDGSAPPGDVGAEPALGRASVHETRIAGSAIADALAEAGNFLVAAGLEPVDGAPAVLRIELPGVPDVDAFVTLLALVAEAAAGAPAVILAGHPPPVDCDVAWTTVTPDPAVIEVNLAPAEGAADLLEAARELHAAAGRCDLSAHRLHYNGQETDSGGGGQITLGGPTPEASPFFLAPALLPSLVRYVNRHPALSYLWSPESTGGAGQAPRADEGARESFRELDLALARLARTPEPDPALLWGALGPFLADASGNAHRAEINVEKLWNPHLGARGRLGLVEFRAFRMAATPELLAAIAALLRAAVAMLAARPMDSPLVDWGDRLHDRFSLPFYLQADLRAVLADLEAVDLGLGPALEHLLLEDAARRLSVAVLPGCRLIVSRAVEFWPLLGDVASQEAGGSRMVDPSTARLEVCLRADRESLDGWRVSARGVALPLRDETDADGPARVAGVRYRAFAPWRGLHPTLPPQAPLELHVEHPEHGRWRLAVHEWSPDGAPYPGLPETREEARARRDARCVLERIDGPAPEPVPAPPGALGEHVLDLRWL